MPSVRKLVALALTPTLLLLASCGRHAPSEVYYLVAANLNLSYWKTAILGFNAAGARYKVTVKVAGPNNYDPQAELQELKNAVAAKPAGILISVADEVLLKPGFR
jgi:ribose transport system substrate-binding protein